MPPGDEYIPAAYKIILYVVTRCYCLRGVTRSLALHYSAPVAVSEVPGKYRVGLL